MEFSLVRILVYHLVFSCNWAGRFFGCSLSFLYWPLGSPCILPVYIGAVFLALLFFFFLFSMISARLLIQKNSCYSVIQVCLLEKFCCPYQHHNQKIADIYDQPIIITIHLQPLPSNSDARWVFSIEIFFLYYTLIY